jgi:hypothetical protein
MPRNEPRTQVCELFLQPPVSCYLRCLFEHHSQAKDAIGTLVKKVAVLVSLPAVHKFLYIVIIATKLKRKKARATWR